MLADLGNNATKSPCTKEVTASYLEQRIAQFRAEHDKMMAIDNELQALREQRKNLTDRIQQATDRREELRQERVNQLVHGEPDVQFSDEHRELGELIEAAQAAISQSELQEKQLILPLDDAHKAVTMSRAFVIGGYAKELENELPTIIKALKPKLADLAAITHAKACTTDRQAALGWARTELLKALDQAMVNHQVAAEENQSAAYQALAMPAIPRSSDLLTQCDSPGKRQRLMTELNA
ncbi:hypothetical protein GO993_11010 [Aeromonas salmonicida subsp. salmonicida]|uniref:hypothetical protein n=1 Tax=Aeromonas salmonicida TaxID=645 RepID=UPI00131F8B7D|nr:hypothetical protein [Aeromonas salmonicida]QHE43058.1 hypothetical protein GO992_06610 [Aeromonas salmonicida subsp. salmonicida]QHE48460.1 hypothetical protein GO994_15475 [Aeromonas salmonicida subsp. salmonicida]QJF56014.1 hypothetical protein GO993_11010 [Aeromonas salmonicida subsp. salmonicida]